MKKILRFAFFLAFLQFVISCQDTSKKYQLNKLDSTQTFTTKKTTYQLINTQDGLGIVENPNGTKNEFSFHHFELKTDYIDTYVDTKIERIVNYEISKYAMTVEGKEIESTTENQFVGEKIIFTREKNKWKAPEFDRYDSIQKDEIESHLLALNRGNNARLQDFVYPDFMRIGETMQLKRLWVNNFFDLDDVRSATGTFTLTDVIEENNETIAVFTVDFMIEGTLDGSLVSTDFEGTIKRSISKFYDKDLDLYGELTMYITENRTNLKVPCKLHFVRSLD